MELGEQIKGIHDPVLGSRTPPLVSLPPTLPKPKLCDCAHFSHMRAPKATTVTRIASLWGGCSSSPLCDSYRPRFETWVRIRYFEALSIRGPTARSSSDFRGSEV